MTHSKAQGGMGFRDMRLFNQALLARQAQRLITFLKSLCARVLKACYYPRGNITATVFTGNPSSSWTTISYGLELLKKGIVWRVGNGRSIRIWRDCWLPRISNGQVLAPKRSWRIKWVSELLDEQGCWKTQLIRITFYPIGADAILENQTIKAGFC
jgi:hypothetical protein